MADHVVLGAGSIGTNIARLLVARGDSVLMVTRSGSGPEHPLVERVAADATDAARLTELSRGARTIFHAANPPSYTTWQQVLPPLQTAAILVDELQARQVGLRALSQRIDTTTPAAGCSSTCSPRSASSSTT